MTTTDIPCTYFECERDAKYSMKLDIAPLMSENTVLVDNDGTQRVTCHSCDREYHLNCDGNLSEDVCTEDMDYDHNLCSESGCFMA